MSARPELARVCCGVPALLLAVLGLPLAAVRAPAADLPRVFFSPAERAQITRDRLAGRPLARNVESPGRVERAPVAGEGSAASVATSPDTARPSAPSASSDAAPSTGRVARVEGVTVGRGGGRAVWIDGERIADGARWRGYRVQVTDDGARLVAGDGSVRQVRVGTEILR